ncbi:hypothetical protein KZ813_02535 [Sphingomonas sp. RHCKR7]|jgi:hypothetical protein|uniref:hypothetical protein n=1 Tax=Sphingomonas folli TaxID=2862497 RepID=UPI001CA4CAC7|nr:hypothetical protein [Sphingomonas folli]MBW6525712.1 hypothetical protein [Sphingomonas folli]
MDDLDRALARLAGAPVPTALEGIEEQVLVRISARPVVRQAGLGLGVVTMAALAIGMIGAELPATASPAVSLAPLGGASPLAPSSLLIGEP